MYLWKGRWGSSYAICQIAGNIGYQKNPDSVVKPETKKRYRLKPCKNHSYRHNCTGKRIRHVRYNFNQIPPSCPGFHNNVCNQRTQNTYSSSCRECKKKAVADCPLYREVAEKDIVKILQSPVWRNRWQPVYISERCKNYRDKRCHTGYQNRKKTNNKNPVSVFSEIYYVGLDAFSGKDCEFFFVYI